ncbi:(2Fe-2S)-binding protein [Maricurvus nonylphenolicus]|uniref:(2Fe-2S)-binding protein n=1 Tax=Maricurvus nonylphenolicus TaxID=1008307 RepID=UPI0036F22FA5
MTVAIQQPVVNTRTPSATQESIQLTINGQQQTHHISSQWTLTHFLRNELSLTGTKETCAEGACGSCTVLVDGLPTLACVTMVATLDGKTIETIEGMANGNNLHPIQQAFVDERGSQCGYCSPGFIMTTKHLLENNPNPTDTEIKQALSGNICRCAAYEHIVNAVNSAAATLAKEVTQDD